MNEIIDKSGEVTDTATESNKITYDIQSFETFLCEACATGFEGDWIFDIYNCLLAEHRFVKTLKALFILCPEFFEEVKTAKNKHFSACVCEDIFSIFEE